MRKSFFLLFCLFSLQDLHSIEAETNRFVVITPPKCGTYLLAKVMSLLTGKEFVHYNNRPLDVDGCIELMEEAEQTNRFVIAHLVPSKKAIIQMKKRNYKVLTILRDPRDQLLSLLNHFLEKNNWPNIPIEDLTLDQQVRELITGEQFGFQAYENCIENRMGWRGLSSSISYCTRFEDLIGIKGGGNEYNQIKEICNLAHHIGLDVSVMVAREVADQSFGGTLTFKTGQIGQWKEVFSEENKTIYKNQYGQAIQELGYEKSYDW